MLADIKFWPSKFRCYCTVACIYMIINANYGKKYIKNNKITQELLAYQSGTICDPRCNKYNCYGEGIGTSLKGLENLIQIYNLPLTKTNEEIENLIGEGKIVLVYVKWEALGFYQDFNYSEKKKPQHCVIVLNNYDDEFVYVHDPAFYPNLKYFKRRFCNGVVVKYALG